jgi:hypothetical protein
VTDKWSGELAVARNMTLLRALVAALGERANPPWWRTQFLTDAGLRAAQRIFPRTGLAAAIKSTSAAAQAEHDRLIGVGGRYHLFRLPISLENLVARALSDTHMLNQLGDTLIGGRTDSLRARLELLGADKKPGRSEGPVTLGRSNRLHEAAAVAELAVCYHTALANSARAYPYFERVEAAG